LTHTYVFANLFLEPKVAIGNLTNLNILPQNKGDQAMQELKVGVVGYCPPTLFDEDKALTMIQDAYNKVAEQFCDCKIVIVSGLTNVGVLKIAYKEATKRGWRTVGIACERAQEHELYPVDEKLIVGKNWGDESTAFIEALQAIVRVGVGVQSLKETELVKSKGLPAFEYDLPMLMMVHCTECGGSGVYRGYAEPKGVGVVCNHCYGLGAAKLEYIPYTGRKQRDDVETVRLSRGSSIATGVGLTAGSVTYQEFLAGKIPSEQ
jgi:hypothetical protein